MEINEWLLMANNARMHSEEIRTIADSFTYEPAQRCLYGVADDYQKRAERYTELANRFHATTTKQEK